MSNGKLFSLSRLLINNSSNESVSKVLRDCLNFGGKNRHVFLNHAQRRSMSSASTSKWCGPVTDDNVLSSPYGNIELPNCTVTEFVFNHSSHYPDKPAISCGISGKTYSYGTVKLMMDKFAMGLLKGVGLKPGEMVAIVLPNMPEFAVVINGAMEAGMQVTFANPLYTEDELERQFKDCGVKAIVTIKPLLGKCLAVKKKLKDYKGTVLIGQEELEKDGVFGFKPLLINDFQTLLPFVDTNDIALVPYSSGTTGLPKGVILTHRNLVVNLMQIANPTFFKPNEEYATIYPVSDDGSRHLQRTKDGQCVLPGNHDTILTVPPYFHIYGYNGILNYNLRMGNHVVSLPKFTPEDYLACLKKYKPKSLFVVPSLLSLLATHPMVSREDLESIQHIVVGAAPTTDSIVEKFLQKCGKSRAELTLQQGFGMTESSPVATLSPYLSPHSKVVSVGQLVPGTQARIVSLTNKENMGCNLTGELYIKGPQVMIGYFKKPEATMETIDIGGWLHTGDVAYYDEDHFFYIVDRTKELIKVKGNQVSPTELESVIMEMPSVADVAVVGVPDELAGELPKAFVVLKKDSETTEKDIYEWVKKKVVKYKCLDGGVVFVDAIPRNQGGKVMRNELKVLGKKPSS